VTWPPCTRSASGPPTVGALRRRAPRSTRAGPTSDRVGHELRSDRVLRATRSGTGTRRRRLGRLRSLTPDHDALTRPSDSQTQHAHQAFGSVRSAELSATGKKPTAVKPRQATPVNAHYCCQQPDTPSPTVTSTTASRSSARQSPCRRNAETSSAYHPSSSVRHPTGLSGKHAHRRFGRHRTLCDRCNPRSRFDGPLGIGPYRAPDNYAGARLPDAVGGRVVS